MSPTTRKSGCKQITYKRCLCLPYCKAPVIYNQLYIERLNLQHLVKLSSSTLGCEKSHSNWKAFPMGQHHGGINAPSPSHPSLPRV